MWSLKELNEQQKTAVVSVDKKICVIAGPGCGKTRTLVSRVVYLIKERGFKPEEILLLTFSKKAIKEIKERIIKSLGKSYSFRINIHNFHSFCYKFLRDNFSSTDHLQENFLVYDKNDQDSLLKKIFYEFDIPFTSSEINKVLTDISLCKIKDGYLEKMRRENSQLYSFYEKYQEHLFNENAIDFNDLLIYTYRLLSSKQNFNYNFNSILVDEFQDVNDLQWRITKLLGSLQSELFIVGDPNQSIYGFQGSNPNLISSFLNNQAWKCIFLNINYRSTANIVNLSNSFLARNNDLILNQLETSNKLGEKVEVIENCPLRIVIKKILYLIEHEGIKMNSIAIIYRNNYLARFIENELVFNQIPYEILGSFKFIEREEIKDVLAYMKLFIFKSDIFTLRILKNVAGIGTKFIEKLEFLSRESNLLIIDFIGKILSDNFQMSLKMNKAQKEGLSFILDDFFNIEKDLDKKIKLIDFISKLIEKFGYLEKLKLKDKSNDRIRNIKKFIIFAREWENDNSHFEDVRSSLNDFICYCALSFEDSKLSEQKKNVILSSIHQVKGLEFDFVFFVYLDKNILPYVDSTDLTEEKRIFYVGITRAKNFLYLVNNSSTSSQFISMLRS